VKSNLAAAVKIGIRMSTFQDRSHLPYIINQKLPTDLLVRGHLKKTDHRFPGNNYSNSQTYTEGNYSVPFYFNELDYQSQVNPKPNKYGKTGLVIPGGKTKPQTHTNTPNQPENQGLIFFQVSSDAHSLKFDI